MPSVLSALAEAVLPRLTRGVGVGLPTIHALATQGTPLSGQALRAASLGGVVERAPILSANEIIRRTRAMGIRVQRQAALRAIKAIRKQVDAFTYVSELSGGKIPLMDNIPYTATRQRLKYQVTVKVTGQDVETGLVRPQFIRINSSSLITKNEATALAVDAIASEQSYNLQDIVGAEIILMTRQNPNLVNA